MSAEIRGDVGFAMERYMLAGDKWALCDVASILPAGKVSRGRGVLPAGNVQAQDRHPRPELTVWDTELEAHGRE